MIIFARGVDRLTTVQVLELLHRALLALVSQGVPLVAWRNMDLQGRGRGGTLVEQ